jgi:hypothetical protein
MRTKAYKITTDLSFVRRRANALPVLSETASRPESTGAQSRIAIYWIFLLFFFFFL